MALLAVPALAELKGDVSAIEAQDRVLLNRLLKSVGVKKAKITSLERTPERQARVMYDLARKDLDAAKDMYCPAGDAVLEKFDAAKNKQKNLDAMKQELINQLPRARELGCLNHIKNDDVYAVDIGIGQIPQDKHEAFIRAATKAVKQKQLERFLHPPRDPEAFHFEFKRR